MAYNHWFLSETPYFAAICIFGAALVFTVFYFSLSWDNPKYAGAKSKALKIFLPMVIAYFFYICVVMSWRTVKRDLERGAYIISTEKGFFIGNSFAANPRKKHVRLNGFNSFYEGKYKYIYSTERKAKLSDNEIAKESLSLEH